MHILKSNKGSTLVWVLMIFAVAVILGGAVIGAVGAYHRSSLITNEKNQAFLTAKSAINTVLENINSGGSMTEKFPDNEGEYKVATVSFKDANMKNTDIYFIKKNNRYFVKAMTWVKDAKSGMFTEAVFAEVGRQGRADTLWPEYSYVGKADKISTATSFDPEGANGGKGVYLYCEDKVEGEYNLGSSLYLSGDGEINNSVKVKDNLYGKNIIINGDKTNINNIYASGNVTIKEKSSVGGSIISGGSVVVEKDSKVNGNIDAAGNITVDTNAQVIGTQTANNPAASLIQPSAPGELVFNHESLKKVVLNPGSEMNLGKTNDNSLVVRGYSLTGDEIGLWVDQILNIRGDGQLWIYIDKKVKINPSNIYAEGGKNPAVIFVVKDGGSLTFTGDSLNTSNGRNLIGSGRIYIYVSKDGEMNPGNNNRFNGGIYSKGKVNFDGNYISYRPLIMKGVNQWKVVQYMRDLPQ